MMEDTMGGDTNTLMRNNGNDDNNNDNDNDNNNNKNDGRVIAIIDFPKGGTFGLDGQNIILKTNNNNNSSFIGVKDVPSNNTFHLVTCNGNGGTNKNDNDNKNNNNNNTVNTAVTVGFVIFGDGAGRRSN